MIPEKSNPEWLKTEAYKVAVAMTEKYAENHGWKKSRRYGGFFGYEYSMSRLGAKDSKNPPLSIRLTWTGGNDKTVEILRNGRWTACFGLKADGSMGAGQWQGDTGIKDLNELLDLYNSVIGIF